jgi:hypothetical protein
MIEPDYRNILKGCEGRELNPRTPSGTDLESASVGHLDTLAQNRFGAGS